MLEANGFNTITVMAILFGGIIWHYIDLMTGNI